MVSGIRKSAVAAAIAGLALFLIGMTAPGAGLHFNQARYVALLGQDLHVQLCLDMDADLPGDQLPAEGLFSVGVSVAFDPAVASPGTVALPPELDGNGLGGSAPLTVTSGYVGTAGVIDFDATNGYTDAVVLDLELSHAAPGTYTLTPGLYFPSPRANFLDMETGTVLDDQITNFVSSTVLVISQPRITLATRPTADALTLICQLASNMTPASITLEKATPTAGAATWTPALAIPVTPTTAGLYQVDIPLPSATSGWYRISTTW